MLAFIGILKLISGKTMGLYLDQQFDEEQILFLKKHGIGNFTIIAIFQVTLDIYLKLFLKIIVYGFLAHLAVLLIGSITGTKFCSLQNGFSSSNLLLGYSLQLVDLFIFKMAAAAVIITVVDHLFSNSLSFAGSIRRAFVSLPSLVWANIIIFFYAVLFIILMISILFIGTRIFSPSYVFTISASNLIFLSTFFGIPALLYVFYLAFRYMIYSPCVILEGLKGKSGLKRSKDLLSSKFKEGRQPKEFVTIALLIMLVYFALMYAISFVNNSPSSILDFFSFQHLVSYLLAVLMFPLPLIFLSLLYFHIRVKIEQNPVEIEQS